MGAKRKSGDGSAYPLAISRRTVIGAAGATPIAATAVADPDKRATDLCEAWFANEGEIRRLQTKWGEIEAWLMQNHGWHMLTEAEQRTNVLGDELAAIDARLDILETERERLTAALSVIAATDLRAVKAKLQVAIQLIHPSEYPEAHRLLTSTLCDLAGLSDPTENARG